MMQVGGLLARNDRSARHCRSESDRRPPGEVSRPSRDGGETRPEVPRPQRVGIVGRDTRSFQDERGSLRQMEDGKE